MAASTSACTSEDSLEGMTQLNQGEVPKMRSLLGRLEKPTSDCSMAHSCTFPFSFLFCKFQFSLGLMLQMYPLNSIGYWILESLTTCHPLNSAR